MYDRQITRVDAVRSILDEMLRQITDENMKRNGYVHLYGVGQACALLSLYRGHDREYAEIAEVAGMLHDYAKYKHNIEDNHAQIGSKEAEILLKEVDIFDADEISQICHAIAVHSMKSEIHTDLDEILKDADEMQHCLRNPMEDYFYNKPRMKNMVNELNLS